MNNITSKIDCKILVLAVFFAIVFSLFTKDVKKIENFGVYCGLHYPCQGLYQNQPKKTSYARLYFPGMLPGMISRKSLPSLHYTKTQYKPNMNLVKMIQDNAR